MMRIFIIQVHDPVIHHVSCFVVSHFSVLVANPKKLLYTVANPARGLLNREKGTKKETVFNIGCLGELG